jgi:hypothetical protein
LSRLAREPALGLLLVYTRQALRAPPRRESSENRIGQRQRLISDH